MLNSRDHQLGLQHTIRDRIDLSGIGVHSGKSVSLSILPGGCDSGILFRRVDCSGIDIPAILSSVRSTDLCTIIGSPDAGSCDDYVMTVEHLMSAFVSLGVDNAIVELDGPEVPVMDGSSEPFTSAISQVGLLCQDSPRRYLRILRSHSFTNGDSRGEFLPHFGTRFDIEIDFTNPLISRQRYACDLSPSIFCTDIARARTFGFFADVERYWQSGYALDSSLDNSVVIDSDDTIMNPEGLRYPDEFVRHKALDAIGDLSLSGAPLLGIFRSYKGGHKLNVHALRSLMSSPDAWEWSDIDGNSLSLGSSRIESGYSVPLDIALASK